MPDIALLLGQPWGGKEGKMEEERWRQEGRKEKDS